MFTSYYLSKWETVVGRHLALGPRGQQQKIIAQLFSSRLNVFVVNKICYELLRMIGRQDYR
jgi:hypothetical protein